MRKSKYRNTKRNKNRNRSKRYKTGSYEPASTKKYILPLLIMFIIIGVLYYIVPDAITFEVGITEEQEENIREIVKDEIEVTLEEYGIIDTTEEQIEEVTKEVVEEVEEDTSLLSSTNETEVTSRGESTTRTTTKLTGYKITSYHPGDAYSSNTTTGSGKTTSDFGTTTVEGKTVYTYNGKIVVATATKELLASGYNKNGSQTSQNKHYFNYYDTLTITLNGNKYECIVLDSCGAAMWSGEYRVDIFVPSSSNIINASNVTIEY